MLVPIRFDLLDLHSSCVSMVTHVPHFRFVSLPFCVPMELSASDIRNRSFSQGLRGLDSDEVYGFLDEVADRWEDVTRRTQTLEERVHTLESKLDEIGDAAQKARTAKERAEELQEKVEAKKERLDEREEELEAARGRLEAKQAKLRSVAQRVQEVLQEEVDALSSLAPGDEAAEASAPERTNGEATGNDKSSEEWVDSLFPNRLPESEPAADAGQEEEADTGSDEETGDLSAGESQFEAIKQDVQGPGREVDRSSTSDEEDEDGSPPTEEMNQIWDVFDDQEQR